LKKSNHATSLFKKWGFALNKHTIKEFASNLLSNPVKPALFDSDESSDTRRVEIESRESRSFLRQILQAYKL
jgi:type II secretory pathway component GspD/PulD (secretin)